MSPLVDLRREIADWEDELAMRQRYYPLLVSAGRIDAEESARVIGEAEAKVAKLRAQLAREGLVA